METFGPQYPHGSEYLRELDSLRSSIPKSSASSNEVWQAWAALERKALLANPLLSRQPLLFVVRSQYRPDHHNTATFFPNATHEYNDGAFTPGGSMKLLQTANGQVRTLLSSSEGVIRDPEVHWSAGRIVFSMRRNPQDSYHIYEVNADGSDLKQLTFAPGVDDFDPCYAADGSIVFSSTREPKYCACNRHIMANLYRMGPDGANIHQIGKSTLFEGHATSMPDGRILYDRWEYVDRNFGDAQSLWTVNPDGSNHALFWGNNTASPGAVIDARMIPGTLRAICVFGSCHDRPWGALAIIDRSLGVDGAAPVVRTWPDNSLKLVRAGGWELFDAFAQVRLKYEDPWPLSEKYFLCTRMTGKGEQTAIYLLDVFGNELLVHSESPGCFDPMPLRPAPPPPLVAARRDFEEAEGSYYVQDVYIGTHMAGVARGAVKFLRVVESPEKRFWTRPAWNGQGQEAPAMNWHDFNNKRILGTVRVEEDGSAYFTVPAERFVYFQLLDERGMLVQSMRSGTLVQPGEQAGCVGCHESRRQSPQLPARATPMALRRPPQKLQGWHGPPRLFSFMAEVQPVFDRRCLECHDYGKPAAKILNLAPDRDLVFNTAYNELWRKKYIKAIGAGPPETQPAYAWGSTVSRLTAGCKSRLTADELDRVVTWIDLNAPYYPTYASAYPDNLAGRSPLTEAEVARLEQLTRIPLRASADHRQNRGPQVSFDRPELSPCLESLKTAGDSRYTEALTIIREGQKRLMEHPEADMPEFQACAIDHWRQDKYQARQEWEQRSRAAIRTGQKTFDAPPGGTGSSPTNSSTQIRIQQSGEQRTALVAR